MFLPLDVYHAYSSPAICTRESYICNVIDGGGLVQPCFAQAHPAPLDIPISSSKLASSRSILFYFNVFTATLTS